MRLIDDDNGGKIGVCVVRTCLDEQLLLDHSFNIHLFATASMPATSSPTSTCLCERKFNLYMNVCPLMLTDSSNALFI